MRRSVAPALALLLAGTLYASSTALAEIQSIVVLAPDAILQQPSISADGRYVAWQTDATNLIPDDTNTCGNGDFSKPGSCPDIFVFDSLSGTFERVSIADDESEAVLEPTAVAGSFHPSMTPDGRFVVFGSGAHNLVPGDTNGKADIFVRDRLLGTTTRASLTGDEQQPDGDSSGPRISSDGNIVAFLSTATNLVPGLVVDCQPGFCVRLYLRDMAAGTTEMVSVNSLGEQADDEPSAGFGMSGDGSVLSFSSRATNLVPSDTNGQGDVFVRDRVAGTTVRISVDNSGNPSAEDSNSVKPGVSRNGRFIVFDSGQSDLVPGDTNGTPDLFLYDRQTQMIELASVNDAGEQGDDTSGGDPPVVTDDARFIAFVSRSSNLAPGGGNTWVPPGSDHAVKVEHTFLRDRVAGTTVRISVNEAGELANGNCLGPAMSDDANVVVFMSEATNLGAASAASPAALAGFELPAFRSVRRSKGLYARTDCSVAVCGDSAIEPFCEKCDDGNVEDGDGCSHACDLETFAGSKLGISSSGRMSIMSRDPRLTPPINAGPDDPIVHGGTLRVVSAAAALDETTNLPAAGWSYAGKAGTNNGYKFRVPSSGGSLVGTFSIKASNLKMKASGAVVPGLSTDPGPVQLQLRLGSATYCMSFGGQTSFSVDRKFQAFDSPAPATCLP